jgi:ferric-dicitrate binding protein FerR (iron transport regulator)
MAAATLLFIGAGSVLHLAQRAEPAEGFAPQQGATVVEGSLKVGTAPPLTKGNRFVGEAAIETPSDAQARLVTESGVEVALSSASRARLHPAEQRQRVELIRGEVTLQVPPLVNGSTVAVVTPDATVTVHGTRFSVSYDANAARPATCVRVMEGVVSVNRGTGRVESLHAGQSSGCDSVVAPASQPARDSSPRTEVTPERERLAASTLPDRMDDPTSSLASENQLLLAGLAAERRNDDAAARAALKTLLARFPHSPLAGEAKRALSRIDNAR